MLQHQSPFVSPQFAIITLGEISHLHDCNGSEVRVYLALAAHAGPDGDCWPGRRRLAEITGQSREHVSRSTSALEAAGLIEKSQTPTGRTIYHLPLHRRPLVSEQEPTPCQTGHPPMPDPAPIEQTIEQTTINKEKRETDPEPPADPVAEPLSQDVLRKIKTAAPDGLPESWVEQGRLLRPDLDEQTIRNSALIFLDTSRANGRLLVNWQSGFNAWLRRERAPRTAHSGLQAAQKAGCHATPAPAMEAPESALLAFENHMRKLGALQQPDGTWKRPDSPPVAPPVAVAAPVPTRPLAPAPRATQRLTTEQTRRLAALAAEGGALAEVAELRAQIGGAAVGG